MIPNDLTKNTGSNIRRSIAWVILTQIIPAKTIISYKTTNSAFRSGINKWILFRVPSHSFSTRANKNPSKVSEAAFACLSCGEHLQQCCCCLEWEPGLVWHGLSPCLSSSGPFWAHPERTWHPSEQNTQRKKITIALLKYNSWGKEMEQRKGRFVTQICFMVLIAIRGFWNETLLSTQQHTSWQCQHISSTNKR